MADFERIPYSSFLWKLGTTSFRTKEFNRMTEWQLKLLDEFWLKPENAGLGWEIAVPGQNGIYEIKNRYYDWLVENGFTKGDDKVKYKAAREKSSGLYDMGLINSEHRLTDVGRRLLHLSETEDFNTKTTLSISKDSLLYLEQLMKLSDSNTRNTVRPFIIVAYLLTKLEYLSYDEFTYLMPLCTDSDTTEYIINSIRELRTGKGSIEDVIAKFLMSKPNYILGLERFLANDFSMELLLSVSMNRKSPKYDVAYFGFYNALHSVYMENNASCIFTLFNAINKFNNSSIAIKWKKLLFDTHITAAVKRDPKSHLLPLPSNVTKTEEDFKRFFFITMHTNKALATLKDYFDLNRRYLNLTNCFLFEDNQVKFDVVPKQLFKNAISLGLYDIAYLESDKLFENTNLEEIHASLKFDEALIVEGIQDELGVQISNIEEAYSEVDKIRYERLQKLINQKFSKAQLLHLLDCFDNRYDDEINSAVTDNADIPTIFEYVLGIIWYKASENKGKILDYLKLSLDANLLPITHAAGGEADIVYEYPKTAYYPQHNLLLEATLADSTNQRRMEMEPVSRHLGNHLLRTGNKYSYCVFATSFLHINVIGDFMNRKSAFYCDPSDPSKYIESMKIMPLSTDDLRYIIKYDVTYPILYNHFDKAFRAEEHHPQKWYDHFVKLDSISDISEPNIEYGTAAEPNTKYRNPS